MIDFVMKYNKIKMSIQDAIGRKNREDKAVISNSADGSRNRENYSRENVRREYRNTDDRGRERGSGERSSYDRGSSEQRNRQPRFRSENKQERPYNSENRQDRSYNGENRSDRPYNREGRQNQNRSFNNNRPKSSYTPDKDRDEESVKRRSEPKRSQDKDARFKEQQPDKIDIINRLEKEKKAMQKKEEEKKKNSRSARAVSKPKRSNNIDWTREYENDSYDDDEMDMYLSQ